MPALDLRVTVVVIIFVFNFPVLVQSESDVPTSKSHRMHQESARQHCGSPPPEIKEPPIPEGMTLDEVFDYAGSPPPADYPDIVPDDRLYVFTIFEQLEYRVAADGTPDHFGWEAQGWLGNDFNKIWWKNEGESIFDGPNEGGTETDLIYSRLITPFWNFQVGVQYANEWNPDDYENRWSGVIGLQGLAPYKFELDNTFYISEDADATFEFEAEYDLRLTQKLVLQPRTEIGFAFQDISERNLGAGITDANFDLRLRYEIKREFAPYIGVRYRFLVGETDNLAEASGEDTEQFLFLSGLRFAF
jgi:copper resistance protein B